MNLKAYDLAAGKPEGIYAEMPPEVYHAQTALGSSDVIAAAKSGLHFQARREDPPEQTDAMAFGSYVHDVAAMSSPDTDRPCGYSYELDEFGEGAPNRRVKAYQEWKREQPFPIVRHEDDLRARAMVDRLYRSRVGDTWRNGHRELSFFWEEPGFEARCKGRADLLCRNYDPATGKDLGTWTLADLKTVQDAHPDGIERLARSRMHHVQLAWYRRGLYRCGIQVDRCLLVYVESVRPYLVTILEVGPAALARGVEVAQGALHTIREGRRSGTWKGYAGDWRVWDTFGPAV